MSAPPCRRRGPCRRRIARARSRSAGRAGRGCRAAHKAAGVAEREGGEKRIKQRHVGIVDGDPDRLAVYVQRFSLSHSVLPGCAVLLCGLLNASSLPPRAVSRHMNGFRRSRTDPASTNEVLLRARPEERAPRTGNSPIAICARVSKDEGGPETLAGLMLRDASQRGQSYGTARDSSALRRSSA